MPQRYFVYCQCNSCKVAGPQWSAEISKENYQQSIKDCINTKGTALFVRLSLQKKAPSPIIGTIRPNGLWIDLVVDNRTVFALRRVQKNWKRRMQEWATERNIKIILEKTP